MFVIEVVPMNLVEFTQKFSDESACEQHLIDLRWKEGFSCPKCGHSDAAFMHPIVVMLNIDFRCSSANSVIVRPQ